MLFYVWSIKKSVTILQIIAQLYSCCYGNNPALDGRQISLLFHLKSFVFRMFNTSVTITACPNSPSLKPYPFLWTALSISFSRIAIHPPNRIHQNNGPRHLYVSATDWAIAVPLCSLPGFGTTHPTIFHLPSRTERPSYLWVRSQTTSRSPNVHLRLFCVVMFVSCRRRVTTSITSWSSNIFWKESTKV